MHWLQPSDRLGWDYVFQQSIDIHFRVHVFSGVKTPTRDIFCIYLFIYFSLEQMVVINVLVDVFQSLKIFVSIAQPPGG